MFGSRVATSSQGPSLSSMSCANSRMGYEAAIGVWAATISSFDPLISPINVRHNGGVAQLIDATLALAS